MQSFSPQTPPYAPKKSKTPSQPPKWSLPALIKGTTSRLKLTMSGSVCICFSSMALSISKKLLGSSGFLRALRCCNYTALHSHVSGCTLSSAWGKVESSFFASRKLSTSIFTPESTEGAFPSDLFSAKPVLTPERTMGLYQDLVIPVTNFHNEGKSFMVLAGDVFDVPKRKDIVPHVIRWHLAKRQQGTHSTKTIRKVSGTWRKPWPQKGTGQARHGTKRGPQLAIFEDLDVPTHKTKNIVNYRKLMENTKKLLLVDGGPIDEKLKLSTQNLHYVNVLPSIGLNVYSILLHDMLVMSRDAVNRIVKRMHMPINR